MRWLPIVAGVGFAAASIATSVSGQQADNQLSSRSVGLQRQAHAALAQGQFQRADDLLETALAVDPRNRGAFVDLARVAERQKLFGEAIRFTNKALLLEPNDVDALALQGGAMVELGATARAQANLERIRKICGTKACPQTAQLASAIQRGPSMAAAKPAATAPKQN
ncbi:tetratricopeptide repeat protein [Sphingomonas ginkgonis]|uniref:Tetratricopeptide repeat protein n=1 Tax=Sphingomonas ginkgonis TaxID=2315330 RepID=A0A3R9Z692_9SPHN|nr:tetratricopeptide repeat protein [Sphingomonas ginkgonis]RST30799.1 tetratricopeptide repeat protein [Sphingomonas ginkgonis]